MLCPRCKKDRHSDARFCHRCGALLDGEVTRPLEHQIPSPAPARPSTRSFESINDSRFTPGTIVAERYRIVGLLGKGGMGEDYRADDLKLSQPVALKFLPERLLTDGAALARFHHEVRVARQVSHRNVCRVYDIAEVDGYHFLSMEYIDGKNSRRYCGASADCLLIRHCRLQDGSAGRCVPLITKHRRESNSTASNPITSDCQNRQQFYQRSSVDWTNKSAKPPHSDAKPA